MMQNKTLLEQAARLMPGGVNSPVRSFKSVGLEPRIISHAEGAYLVDVEGKRYIDYMGSWGASILGHRHQAIVDAVKHAACQGLSFGATSYLEVELAQKIVDMMPNIEKIRFVNSGTEATMTAIRLARGFTNRSIIVKFEGCYHGHVDSLLVKAGSGALTLGQPDSAGIPADLAALTRVLPYNDADAVRQLFSEIGSEIAAVIVEPIAGNMNMVMPQPDFLMTLSACCRKNGALLIFDEVMTGFRVALQGAQHLYQITPDLTTLGKVIGGGMPVGAIGGKKEIMDYLAPEGPVYQAGTLSGNPVTVSAGLKALTLISEPDFFDELQAKANRLATGLSDAAKQANIPFQMQFQGGMFGFYFSHHIPKNCEQVLQINPTLFNLFFAKMLEKGIYFAPSAFEAGFLSSAHSIELIDQTIDIAQDVFLTLSNTL